jgi:hypothetical protein
MRGMGLIAAALIAFGAAAVAAERPADQPAKPVEPPASGTSSPDLSRSGGVIKPPAGVDPKMRMAPPASGAKMPVIPPPGTPGGDPSVKPK